jgi:dimethylargininase
VPAAESYAANCVRINETVLIAAGFPVTCAALGELGYALAPLDVSEFRKMDGGLSCLSVRW